MDGKALFLDRDGVVNVDGGYVHRIEDFQLVPGILELCRRAKEKGYLVIVATNQSGIGRGMFTEEDFSRLTDYMKGVFRNAGAEIADVFHCPSVDDGHPDRKPNPGLFLKACTAHGLDMASCVSVGDGNGIFGQPFPPAWDGIFCFPPEMGRLAPRPVSGL